MRGAGLAFVVLLLVGACDWLWPAEGPYDPWRCEPRCAPDAVCQRGACVPLSELDAQTSADADGGGVPADRGPASDGVPPPPAADRGTCGTGTIEGGEQCDGAELQGATCTSLGEGVGVLRCSGCKYDRSGCGLAFVPIKQGTLLMGSPDDEPCRVSDEMRHEVTLSRRFDLAVTEVTERQYQAALGRASLAFQCQPPGTVQGDCPAVGVTWHDAAAYCTALSQSNKLSPCYACTTAPTGATSCQVAPQWDGSTGKTILDCPGYRLPTEAEWEYAYRAGTTTAFYGGAITSCNGADPIADAIGWYDQNSLSSTHVGRAKAPNAWGLYDMAGNVAEWCHDHYEKLLGTSPVSNPIGPPSGTERVTRGGWAFFPASFMRAAARLGVAPASLNKQAGVRCAISVAQ